MTRRAACFESDTPHPSKPDDLTLILYRLDGIAPIPQAIVSLVIDAPPSAVHHPTRSGSVDQ
jgi:hypothetical protein